MRLGLGIGVPYGSGVLNPDKLSLDLQFATDKTLTARKGPTPTFTRGSGATFVGSDGLIQSAAINAPRFDHDPETFACKGLLIEEQRWNLTPNSQNPAGWTSGNGTVTNQGSIISPSGANDGYLAGIGVADLNSTNTTSQPSAAYTASVFLKRDNTDWVRLQLAHVNNTNTVNAWFDLATGAVGTVSIGVGTLTFLSAQITPFGNNWYRCSVTATFPTAGTLSLRVISTTVNNSVSRVAGSIYGVWGFQLEAGSFPTSYIPTTTAALFRSADVCSITGGDFTGMYNGLEGTIIAEGSVANLAGNNRGMWAINNNTSAHGFLTYYDVTTAGISSQSRNTGSTTLTPNFLNSANTLFKRALAYRTGQASICTNGSSVTATDVTISTQAMLTLQVGNMLAGSFYWSGHIARIRYFKKHLPDAKLQSLTTL